MLRLYSALLTLLVVVVASSITAAYGHGLGRDQALPVTIGERQLTVEAVMTPTFVPIQSSVQPTLAIRAHDEYDNATIKGIDYRIVVELRNEKLLDQRFRSSDGVVIANLKADDDIDGWQINGKMPPPQAQVSQAEPVELTSKIMSAGGLYHIKVTVESSSTGVNLQSDHTFDLYVSIGMTYTYDVGGGQIVVKTYYDDITNFDYSNGTISFQMPFTWDAAYVSQVPVLHIETQFPKTIEQLQTNSYRGTLNGRELEAQAIVIDDYTSAQNRIVHFVVNNAMLSRFAETMEETDLVAFALTPSEMPKFPLDIMSLPNERFLVQLSWGPDVVEAGIPMTFVMNIKDPATDEILRGSSFDFVVMQGGSEIHREHMADDLGLYSFQYTFADAGTVTISASNINGQGESAKIDLAVVQGTGGPAPPSQQPSGCLIATAAFGSELTPQVQYLRNFRDNYILSTISGSAFMSAFNSVYYLFSPQIADYERDHPWLQAIVKTALYPLFGILTAAEHAHSVVGGEAGAILSGSIASSLIGAVYLGPAGFVARKRINNKWLLVGIVAAAVVLVTTLVAAPAMLSISTSAFVIVSAGASAISVAKAIVLVAHTLRK